MIDAVHLTVCRVVKSVSLWLAGHVIMMMRTRRAKS